MKDKGHPPSKIVAKTETSVATTDPLDREVSIAAALEKNGVKVKASSRAVAALDRLVGNLADIPSVFVEPFLNQRRDKTRLDNELRQVISDKAVEAARKDDSLGSRYLDSFRLEQASMQNNRLKIANAAVEDLRTVSTKYNEEETKIDDDWMNEFINFASRKSDPNIQVIWGRLLAGKIRNPKSNKLKTIYSLAMLDSDDAIKIYEFLLYAIDRKFVARIDRTAHGDLNFEKILEMEDLGILGSSQNSIEFKENITKDQSLVLRMSGDLIKFGSNEVTAVKLPVYPLTAFGRELAALITIEPTPTSYLEDFARSAEGLDLQIKWQPVVVGDSGEAIASDDWQDVFILANDHDPAAEVIIAPSSPDASPR